jgi:hypothetical protein
MGAIGKTGAAFKWWTIREALPPSNEPVLVWTNAGLTFGELTSTGWHVDGVQGVVVTHWMPCPRNPARGDTLFGGAS